MEDKANAEIGSLDPYKSSRSVVAALLGVLSVVPLCHAQQNQPSIQITSPANNTVVNPGQTITVSVNSPNNTTFTQVSVVGDGPIKSTALTNSLPAQLSLTIPQKIALGNHFLTGIGATGAGSQPQFSTQVTIDVERPDMPTRLKADPVEIIFGSSQGDTERVGISGTFADGSYLDVSGSSYVSFSCSNTSVATVDSKGFVTSVAQGTATVTATYTLNSQNISVSVPVTVPPPNVTASPTSLNFTNQTVGTSSPSQTVTITNVSTNPGMAIYPLNLNPVRGDFSETDNCSSASAINVGATCTINVTFTPIASGSRTGALSIQDDLEYVPIVIPLGGTGVGGPPTIASLSPNSGAVGTSVTITGNNFSSPQGSSIVTFNGTSATPSSWSNTSIVVPVPAGATTGNVVVTVGGAASNGVTFTVQGTTNGIIFVQRATIDISNASSGSLSFESGNNAAGNWIGVCIRAGRSNEVFTVTDSKGNTYHQAVQFNDTLDTPNGNTIAIFYAENISAGANTITVSDTISATLRFAILEYTGVATANSLDVTAAAQGSSTSPNSGSVTTTASGDLLLGAIATADSPSYSTPESVVIRAYVPGQPGSKLIAEEQIQSAVGPGAAFATLAESDPWGAILACFKKAHP